MLKSLIGKYLLIFLLAGICGIGAQTIDSIRSRNKDLERVKKEISNLEKDLQNKSRSERESLQSLENLNKQNLLLHQLINNLLAEEKEKESGIGQVQEEINGLEKRIAELKERYSNYIVWVYKNRGLTMWRFILDAESFNQAVKRFKYLQYVSNENSKVLAQLNGSRDQMRNLKADLEVERNEKNLLAKQKLNEQKTLQIKEKESKDLLTRLKKDKKMLSEEIASKRKAEIAIKNIIAKLIETDRERKAKALTNKVTSKTKSRDFDYSKYENFAQLKGKLGWPIKEGRIVRNFGENKNERLNTVTLNYGIDISVKNNKNVLCVAEGMISAIDWIPGYGSVVIITHRDDYRTVYGHVADIAVKEGDKVKAGNFIGTVNESLEGNILHFEIWNERNYQNPEIWLARR